MSAVLTSIFLSNKKAKIHVALRLRQLIDRFTVGNSVGPIVSIALIARPQIADSPQHSTRRWAEPSVRYAVSLPEFVNIMDVTETSMWNFMAWSQAELFKKVQNLQRHDFEKRCKTSTAESIQLGCTSPPLSGYFWREKILGCPRTLPLWCPMNKEF